MPSSSCAPGILLVTQVMDETHPVLGFFVRWVALLAERGNPITVVCWARGTCATLPKNVTIVVLPKGKLRRWLKIATLSWRLRHEYSSVFIHMIPPVAAVLGWWWRLLGLKLVLWYTHGSVDWSLKIAAIFCHRLLTATPESLRLQTPKKYVTGHGIDLDTYHQINGITREPILLSVSRISPRKQLEHLLDICETLHKTFPELSFKAVIVGAPIGPLDEAYQTSLKARAQTAGINHIIEWVGAKVGQELLEIYSRAALFVSTSATGSLDKVVLEAMACETPVVAEGAVYHTLKSVRVLPHLNGQASIEQIKSHLTHPSSDPKAREEVRLRADLKLLIQRIHQELTRA